MRGIPSGFRFFNQKIRITPAHAGNTSCHSARLRWPWDHPRACGEYIVWNLDLPDLQGSPPRMRGILRCCPSASVGSGITPAHAGNTSFFVLPFLLYWDHPRACGEYTSLPYVIGMPMGSPPRMRGILQKFINTYKKDRITPAHAGNTKWSCGCA